MHVSGLYLYPVKSLRGFAVSAAEIDALGFVSDRRFMVVDASGQFLTQRSLPRMALVETALTARDLVLRLPHGGACAVPLRAERPPEKVRVRVWKSDGLIAEDCGVEVAVWLSDFLRTPCRLVRIGKEFIRPVDKPGISQPGDVVNFADGHPFLVISEASLEDLNRRMDAPLPMNRFRPSFVVTGCEPYAEDTWARLRVGENVFRASGPCARCTITTTDQFTASRGKEPLRTLATYRRDPADPADVNFGQNLIHETKSGTLHLGDAVTPMT
ncbi:MAG: molybdenum cofactor biosysynthesis protein [Verrucomicrobia bacterium]|nr:molybdenum cofactor biosysynthesis protein [Verrucomicrobiota bacterium]